MIEGVISTYLFWMAIGMLIVGIEVLVAWLLLRKVIKIVIN